MQEFAKLYVVDGEQVLFWCMPEHGNNKELIKISSVTIIDGTSVEIAAYYSYEHFKACWSALDQIAAEQYRKTARLWLEAGGNQDKSSAHMDMQPG